MSGIYIPDMKMPIGNEVIYIFSDGTTQKAVLAMRETLEMGKAIPVPPHGDLIDRDETVKTLAYDYAVAADIVREIPTIIPADPAGKGDEE